MLTLPTLLRPVKVNRDFNRIYRNESDPWNIGNAEGERYDIYYELLSRFARSRTSLLDIGCGLGAFLARFERDFQELTGIEVSDTAVGKARQNHPRITFIQASAADLDRAPANAFDAIIYSDVICYLSEADKNRSLKWISNHLTTDGIALLAAWCPGGKYLEFEELRRLARRYFAIVHERRLETGHAVFVCRNRRRRIAITVDYETWQPIPSGRQIDWERDVFGPANRLFDLFAGANAKLTIMAEMAEYFWLRENDPDIAARMEGQWREAILKGHDVQLHLHPHWLPELGARFQDGNWFWDHSKLKANDYPGDLAALIKRCKARLEEILRTVKPAYKVTSFRAGAYAAQPFKRLHDALTVNGIWCDSSVYAGGASAERGYDYSYAYSEHQPYFANSFDPQLKAPASERAVIELPIFCFDKGRRWSFDGEYANEFAGRLLKYLNKTSKPQSTENLRRIRFIKGLLSSAYFDFKPGRAWLNKALPRRVAHWIPSYGPESLVEDDYYVLIAHTKADLNMKGIKKGLQEIQAAGNFEFVTLSEMAVCAREELLCMARKSHVEEAEYQVAREYSAIMGSNRNDAQSYYLQEKIPWDRRTILDLGCGAGYWSHRISTVYPWMETTGVDWGGDFIETARSRYGSERTNFRMEDFANLSLPAESVDCVYADNSLEHSFDVGRTLDEVMRVSRWGGVLVAAVPSDGRNPRCICDNHTWKSIPHEVKMRLEAAGFVNIEIEEVDTFRELGMPPYPPSNDQMMYIRAWKRRRPASMLDRALEAMAWVYDNLSPDKPAESHDPIGILAGGYAFCIGYTIVLGKMLEREGIDVRWVTMMAKDHPRGRGTEQIDSHEVLEVTIDGSMHILDPMANAHFPHSLVDLLEKPGLATGKIDPDARYRERCYNLYATDFWYRRVFKYAFRENVEKDAKFIDR
ncbi:MAG: methyltransferase domain-containing protein [Acidobacteria bacterium]|nr:methyltransferase domain-containing protein [Acidobacteriota bacterium]